VNILLEPTCATGIDVRVHMSNWES
jgi:hypothetical protein